MYYSHFPFLANHFWVEKQCLSFPFPLSFLNYSSSFTDTDPLRYPALFADHIAAPVKFAVATFAPCLLQNVVAPPAAQALTVVHVGASLVADPTLCAP